MYPRLYGFRRFSIIFLYICHPFSVLKNCDEAGFSVRFPPFFSRLSVQNFSVGKESSQLFRLPVANFAESVSEQGFVF